MAKKKPKDSDKKLRLDANEIAHRVMLEATGQKPKTVPPSEREDEDKDPEAVNRGSDYSGSKATLIRSLRGLVSKAFQEGRVARVERGMYGPPDRAHAGPKEDATEDA